MKQYGHLTLQIGEYNIDVPFSLKGLDLAREFIDLMGNLLEEDQDSGEKTTEEEME